MFNFATYKEPKFYKEMKLSIDESKSTNVFRLWSFYDENNKWSGWGHQISKVLVTLSAIYNPDEEITTLSMSSWICAITAGSVHICETDVAIFSAKFLL